MVFGKCWGKREMGGGEQGGSGTGGEEEGKGGELVCLLPFFPLTFSAQSKASFGHGDAARWG